jgi:hypothetical protein
MIERKSARFAVWKLNKVRLTACSVVHGLRIAVAIGLAGCLFETANDGGGIPRLARLTLEVRIGADGQLYKPAADSKTAVSLDRMIVTLSSGKLKIRDTVTPEGSRLSREPAYLNPLSAYPQSVLLRYELKPDRVWNASVEVYDDQDSIRYSGSLSIDDMDAFEYLDGCLPVEPRFGVYETRIRLPAGVESDGVPGSARGLRALYFDRLELRVNGETVMERLPGYSPSGARDNRVRTADPGQLSGAAGVSFFRPTDVNLDLPMTLSYDYVSLAATEFDIEAYGYLEGDTLGVTPERLLYRGRKEVNVAAAKVSVDEPLQMVWQAVDAVPSGGTATGMEVRLGRAGKVVMQVVVPGGIAL